MSAPVRILPVILLLPCGVSTGGCTAPARQEGADPSYFVRRRSKGVPNGGTHARNPQSNQGTSSVGEITSPRREPGDPAMATVDGAPIRSRELLDVLLESRGPAVLEQLIVLHAAEKVATGKGLGPIEGEHQRERDLALRRISAWTESDEMAGRTKRDAESLLGAVLARKGLSATEFNLGLRVNAVLRRIVEAEHPISEAEIDSELRNLSGDRVVVRHIQLASLADVSRVTELLKSGAEFHQVAATQSTDASSAPRGGLLEPFTADDENIPRLIRESAFQMNPGDVSSALRVDSWYHLIRVEQRLGPVEFETGPVRDRAMNRIRRRRVDPEMQALRERLIRDSRVEVLDPVLSEAWRRVMPR